MKVPGKHEVAPGVFVTSARVSQLRYPERRHARQVVASAIRSGRLTPKPCYICGQTPTEAHHRDYSRPLRVQWLCRLHHREADKGMKYVRQADVPVVYHVTLDAHRAGVELGRKGGLKRAEKYNKKSA